VKLTLTVQLHGDRSRFAQLENLFPGSGFSCLFVFWMNLLNFRIFGNFELSQSTKWDYMWIFDKV
jgi:hypothetical protein